MTKAVVPSPNARSGLDPERYDETTRLDRQKARRQSLTAGSLFFRLLCQEAPAGMPPLCGTPHSVRLRTFPYPDYLNYFESPDRKSWAIGL